MKTDFGLAVMSATVLNLLFAWTSHMLGPLGEWFTYVFSRTGLATADVLSVFLVSLFYVSAASLAVSSRLAPKLTRALLWTFLLVLPLPIEVALFDSGEVGFPVMTIAPAWLTNMFLLTVCIAGSSTAILVEYALHRKIKGSLVR
ncbi:MAG: hypothetical protein JRN68_08555 [Nitrososphaerota archaeon]|nr:hypothetical protein [Nitrososphaerota archaeon]MDG6981109.1 hypothetical protein [Nitrososphaerota archaeon]MDG6990745.1 hypothetical protein [Nitrososphaerota archaeon]